MSKRRKGKTGTPPQTAQRSGQFAVRFMNISLGSPQSYDPATREVEAVISTGMAVRREDWSEGPYDEVLEIAPGAIRLERLNAGAALIDSHCWYGGMDAKLGALVPGTARIEGGKLLGRFKISRNEKGEALARDLQDGIVVPLSAGYIVHGYRQDSSQAVPVRTVTDWEPIEVSVVTIPAEGVGAGFRALPVTATASRGEPQMKLFRKPGENDATFLARILEHLKTKHVVEGETENQLRQRGMSYMARADEKAAKGEMEDGEEDDEDENVDGGEGAERSLQGQQQQQQLPAGLSPSIVADVNAIGARAGMTPQEIADEWRKHPTIEAFRTRAFDILADRDANRETRGSNVGDAGNDRTGEVRLMSDELDARGQAMAHALMVRMHAANRRPVIATPEQRQWAEARGLVDNVSYAWRVYDGREAPKVPQARQYLGMSIVEMAAELIGYRGKGVLTTKRAEDILRTAFARSTVFQSTTDFGSIFENVMNKVLLDRYSLAMPTYREVAVQRNFVDFRPHNMVRAGDFPMLQELADNGEIRYGSTLDSKELVSVKPYAIAFAISRQMMVNDDLGAIDQVLAGVGDGVLIFENNTFWTMFKSNPILNQDGKAVFTYGTIASGEHNNYADTHAHGGDPPNVSTVAAGRQAMMEQKSQSGNFLNVSPAILLTGPVQQTAAEMLLATISPALVSSVNPFSGKMRPITEAQLTGNDWYMLADPQRVANFVYGFLNGATGPRIRSDEPFGVQGMRISVEHDFGCGAIDFRGAYRNSGLTA